mgnify:CR=1 FL=1|tara:strand:+ start:48 stop:1091 length:1044 start_codon:yes stop_codon:yes gene_type:complete
MKTKNSTQMSIPLDLFEQPQQEISKIVKQNWNLTFARQKKVSIYTKRIMSTVLAQIKHSKGIEPYYRFRVSDVIKPTDNLKSKSPYSYVKEAMDEMMGMIWKIEDVDKKKYVPRAMIDSADDAWGYDDGTITVVLNRQLKDVFLELSHYATFELQWMMVFESWYSTRLYELLSAFDDNGYWIVSLDEFKALMDCADKYKTDSATKIIDKLTSVPKKELAKSPMSFEVEGLEDTFTRGKKGRKKIVALKFTLTKWKPKTKIIDFEEDYQSVLNDLVDIWKIKEKAILKYAQRIGKDEAIQIRRSFQMKEQSQDKISNKEHYCTSVWVKVGSELSQTNMEQTKGFFKIG